MFRDLNTLWREEWERIGLEPDELEEAKKEERAYAEAGYAAMMRRAEIARQEHQCEVAQRQEQLLQSGDSSNGVGSIGLVARELESLYEARLDSLNDTGSTQPAFAPARHAKWEAPARPSPTDVAARKTQLPLPTVPEPPPYLGVRLRIFASELDDLAPLRSLRSYLSHSLRVQSARAQWGEGRASHAVQVLPGMAHGGWLMDASMCRVVQAAIRAQPSHVQFQERRQMEVERQEQQGE